MAAALVLLATNSRSQGSLEPDLERQKISIPVGSANKTLAQFMRLTGVEILFEARRAKGVRTKAIDGFYTTLEGLIAMTEGTRCEVVPVSGGKAYAIKIKRAKKGGKDPERSDNQQLQQIITETQMNLENTKKKRNLGGLFKGLLTIALASGPAQSSAQDDTEEEVYELSPFTVQASEDTGYRATSTLAGTRIRTDLKDVGSALSVVTEAFLEDTGAVDNETC